MCFQISISFNLFTIDTDTKQPKKKLKKNELFFNLMSEKMKQLKKKAYF